MTQIVQNMSRLNTTISKHEDRFGVEDDSDRNLEIAVRWGLAARQRRQDCDVRDSFVKLVDVTRPRPRVVSEKRLS